MLNSLPDYRRKPPRRGMLTLEMVLTLPILLIVGMAIIQFSLMLMGSQAISAAAHVGVREACLPGTSFVHVDQAVRDALAGWSFKDDVDVLIFVNNQPESVVPLGRRRHGDRTGAQTHY